MAPLSGSVAEELIDFMLVDRSMCRLRPLGVDLLLASGLWRTLSASFNVDTWVSPAYGSHTYVPAARPVSLKLNGERERAW